MHPEFPTFSEQEVCPMLRLLRRRPRHLQTHLTRKRRFPRTHRPRYFRTAESISHFRQNHTSERRYPFCQQMSGQGAVDPPRSQPRTHLTDPRRPRTENRNRWFRTVLSTGFPELPLARPQRRSKEARRKGLERQLELSHQEPFSGSKSVFKKTCCRRTVWTL